MTNPAPRDITWDTVRPPAVTVTTAPIASGARPDSRIFTPAAVGHVVAIERVALLLGLVDEEVQVAVVVGVEGDGGAAVVGGVGVGEGREIDEAPRTVVDEDLVVRCR